MLSEESVSQKDVAGFLLGLGIGLVVGIVFKTQPEGSPHYLVDADTSKIPPRNSWPESVNAVKS